MGSHELTNVSEEPFSVLISGGGCVGVSCGCVCVCVCVYVCWCARRAPPTYKGASGSVARVLGRKGPQVRCG